MCRMTDKEVLRLEQRDGEWVLAGEHAARFGLVDEYLAHLLDRVRYRPQITTAQDDVLRQPVQIDGKFEVTQQRRNG